MRTFMGHGERHHFIAPNGGVTDGEPRHVGNAVGVVGVTAAQGEEYSLLTDGEYRQKVAKATNTAYKVGDLVYFKTVNTLTLVKADAEAGSPIFGYLIEDVASAAGTSVDIGVQHGRVSPTV